jgi:tetratricopeptide (TPR) repeat protein
MDELGNADTDLALGDYARALPVYERMVPTLAPPALSPVRYRLGLCLEGMRRWNDALTVYRELASREPDSYPGMAALFGEIRICTQLRRYGEAKALLCSILLRSTEPPIRNGPFLAVAWYLLGEQWAVGADFGELPGPLNTAVAHAQLEWPAATTIDWASPPMPERSSPFRQEAALVLKQKSRFGDSLVEASKRGVRIDELLGSLCQGTGVRLEWTTAARERVEGRSTRVGVKDFPLADLLDALLDPLGLVWRHVPGQLAVLTEQELPREELVAMRLVSAQRALRTAALLSPDHPLLTPAAYLELGNTEYARGKFDLAAAWYDRLLKDYPHSTLLVKAAYNLGLAYDHLARDSDARYAFFRAADESPSHELAPLAYLKVGRSLLEEDRAEQAVRPLRRAQLLAPHSEIQTVATLTLAAAHLLNNNPRAANSTLLEYRGQVTAGRFLSLAVFLDALARVRSISGTLLKEREVNDLLAAVLALREDPVLGTAGRLLVGQAYRELGLQEQMAVVYEKALPAARGPLAVEMAFVLGDFLAGAEQQRDRARQLLTSVAEMENSKWTARARLRLAEIALDDKRPDDAVRWCKRAILTRAGADIPAVLKVMGRAFEQLGDFAQAARCYAGKMPQP